MALPSRSSLHVRPAVPGDARAIAAIHQRLLPHGFFAELGRRFLHVYHRSFMTSPHAVSLVACRDDDVIGFIAGATDAHAHQRYVIRRHGLQLVVAGSVALLFRPALAMRFVSTRLGRYLRGLSRALPSRATRPTGAGAAPSDEAAVAVLTHVAVDDPAQGVGAGSALVGSFVAQVQERGSADRIELVTLAEGGASAFYERLGWTAAGEHARESVRYRHFVLALR